MCRNGDQCTLRAASCNATSAQFPVSQFLVSHLGTRNATMGTAAGGTVSDTSGYEYLRNGKTWAGLD